MSEANPEIPVALPTDAAGAEARKAELLGNREWGERYINGGVTERAEMHSLNELIANQASAEAAMDQRMSVDLARDRGISEEVIKHHLVDRQPITQAERDGALAWRKQHFADAAWRERYMRGEVKERREAALSSILISSPVKPAA
jgi:hypothetical protein